MFLEFQILGNFLNTVLLLISNLVLFWLRTYSGIFQILKFNKISVWLSIWPVLVDGPCALEKKVSSALVRCSVLEMSIMQCD